MNPIAEIYLNRLVENFNYINSHIETSNILAVVKANAYGHGAAKVSQKLQEIGVYGLCVAMAEELIELRNKKIKIPILHLGVLNERKLELYQSKNNICTINSIDDINIINNFLKGSNKKIYCHLKVDTGMGRLGIPYERADNILESIKNKNNIKLLGIYSHFSSSDENNNEFTEMQLNKFKKIIDIADDLIPEYKNYHISNSAGLLKSNSNCLNSVRAGISLYGVNNTNIKHTLKPVMKLKAPVVFIKNIKRGDSVGYNRKFIAKKDTKIGYLQVGYADGYPLEMINSNTIFYDDNLLSVIGKISMDLTAVDFTNINVAVGDWVTLFGEENNRLEKICSRTTNSPYSILTGIGNRVSREYLN